MFTREVYEQAEKAMLLAREYKLDAVADSLRESYRINAKWYTNPLDFTVAIIAAFDKVGIPVPPDIRKRPDPMYVEDISWEQLKKERESK